MFNEDVHPKTPPAGSTRARRIVGSYEIVRELARGGMAIVYLAHQPALGREVALKELAVFPFANATLAQRFVLESQVAGGLSSANIVTVYDYFESDGQPYIAMEYLQRGSLRPLVGQLTDAQVAGVMEGVLAGLAHAEARGIVHRDIKPENLLVTSDGRVKIADFGIAKAFSTVPRGLTVGGTALGTPGYMAPEQAMGQNIGPWTDLYAVGVVAYEMLVGQLPFEADDWSVLMRHVNDEVPRPRDLRPDLDPRIEEWLLRMLHKDPANRPASAQAAWEELENGIVSRDGAMWRRQARLPVVDDTDADKPLSEAEFPSVLAGPATGQNGGPALPPRTPDGAAREAAAVLGASRRRRRRRVLAGAATAVVLAGAAGGGLALRPEHAGNTVNVAAVEKRIRGQMAGDYDIAGVNCPADVPAQTGASFECSATTRGGQTVRVTVEQLANGYRLTPHL